MASTALQLDPDRLLPVRTVLEQCEQLEMEAKS
jgi:hypothetical protein